MTQIREFKDPNQNTNALAAIPDGYLIGSSYKDGFQSESVPFLVTAHAINNDTKVMIIAVTDEMFTEYRNKLIKQSAKSMPNIIKTSLRDFIEPDLYLQQFAEAVSQMKLTPVARAAMPSVNGQNHDAAYNNMMSLYQESFDYEARTGYPVYANNSIYDSYMIKYYGTAASGNRCVVLAGMDYKGVEYYNGTSVLSAINPLAGLVASSLKKKQAEKSSDAFGHGKPCDAVDWGAENRFVVLAPVEYEEEATRDFINFVSTFHMEPLLRQKFYQLVMQRRQMVRQQNEQLNQQLQANLRQQQASLAANQERLRQTLAANSAAMSAGIMDSWNQKMASDSRISQARSEAIRGVNTYTTSYGQNVDVSVTADHVYQNQYGDVYGVSGNAVDQDVLTRLNWTELKK